MGGGCATVGVAVTVAGCCSGREGVGGRAAVAERAAERVTRVGEPWPWAGADTGLAEIPCREMGATPKCGFDCEDADTGGLSAVEVAADVEAVAVTVADTGFAVVAFLGDAARDFGLRGEVALFGIVGLLAAVFLLGDPGGRPLRDGGDLTGEEARTSFFTFTLALLAREPGFFRGLGSSS